jgi:hypothetical protein
MVKLEYKIPSKDEIWEALTYDTTTITHAPHEGRCSNTGHDCMAALPFRIGIFTSSNCVLCKDLTTNMGRHLLSQCSAITNAGQDNWSNSDNLQSFGLLLLLLFMKTLENLEISDQFNNKTRMTEPTSTQKDNRY